MLRAHYHSTLSCGGDEDDDVAIPCEKDNVDDALFLMMKVVMLFLMMYM